MLRPGTARCQCAACGAYFSTDRNFRRHRVGDIAKRRCLRPSEMAAKGLCRDARGIWVQFAPSARPARTPAVTRGIVAASTPGAK